MSNGYINGKPDVSWWLTQIREGVKFRKQRAYENKWPVWRKYYRGEWHPNTLPVNLFFKLLRSTVPRTYFRNPYVSITSRRSGPDGMARATILERVDNKMLKQMKVKKQMKGMVRDGFMFGTFIGKLGYGAEFTPTPDLMSTEAPDAKGAKGQIERVEYNSTVLPNMPWFLRTHPGAFIVPSGLIEWEDTRWCANWLRRPLDDVRADPRMKNTKDLRPSSKNKVTELGDLHVPGSIDMIDLIEIRDKKTQKVIVLAPYATDRVLLFDDDGMQFNGGLPFYPGTFNDDDESFWGIPDAQILEPQQREINEIRTQIMKHRRAALVKLLIQEGMVTPEEAIKIFDEEAPAVIWTKDNPELATKVLQAGGVPQDLFVALEGVYNEVRETLGFSRNDSGEYQPGSRKPTATEVQRVSASSDVRTDEKRDSLADILVDVVEDMHQVLFTEWKGEQIVQVAGPDGAPVWVRFQPEMLRSGQYEVSIDPDSAASETRDVRRQRAFETYATLKDNPIIRPEGLTRYFLNELGNVAFDDLMQPIAGPGSQQNPLQMQQYQQLLASGMQQGGTVQ